MPKNTAACVTYYRRGMVERWIGTGKSRRIVWQSAYSGVGPDGGVLYPWMTIRECRADAQPRGLRVVFAD